ncbi:MAG TPA: hypothetical protein PKD13_14050 [Mariniflexile sp.]|nr:hypothetical protein [Mariniflexile sp.]
MQPKYIGIIKKKFKIPGLHPAKINHLGTLGTKTVTEEDFFEV